MLSFSCDIQDKEISYKLSVVQILVQKYTTDVKPQMSSDV
jgi:hypothetical protein